MSIITITADSNEKGSQRMADLMSAILPDSRFAWGGYASLPVDLQFSYNPGWGEHGKPKVVFQEPVSYFNVELKEPPDFVSSVLGGHFGEQVLAMQELQQPCMGLITGEWLDVQKANAEACLGRGAKAEIKSNYLQLKSFKKRSYLQGVRMFYPGDDSGFFDGDNVWVDLLELVHDAFTDGSLAGFMPKPAKDKRELYAAAMLFGGNGIGPKTLEPVMQDYHLCLLPKVPDARPISTFSGIGPKRLSVLDKKVKMVYV